MDTKENRSSTTMPHKKGLHVNIDIGVLRKIKVLHPHHITKEKEVLRKQRARKLCKLRKGDMSQKRKGY